MDLFRGCVVENCDRPGTSFSCPHCLAAFCVKHGGDDRFQVKLDGAGQFNVNGSFRRVCIYCFWERQTGDSDQVIFTGHMNRFTECRKGFVERLELESLRLERRLQKLSEWNGVVAFREYCQRLIPWEADESSDACRCCLRRFHPFLNRKHHCRFCGSLVCISCSESVPIELSHEKSGTVLCCSKCHSLLFKYNEYAYILGDN